MRRSSIASSECTESVKALNDITLLQSGLEQTRISEPTITPPETDEESNYPTILHRAKKLETIVEEPIATIEVPVADEVDSDSGSEWITPSNLKSHQSKQNSVPEKKQKHTRVWDVGCVTTDFAMQVK